MELSIISFTTAGKMLSEKIESLLEKEIQISRYCKFERLPSKGESKVRYCEESLNEWTGKQFALNRGILFIGACGIAVRAIAPHLKDKLSDVPVLVMDEAGKFIIPILSGHYGGANNLCSIIADRTGACPVITTATDINRKFAVDTFAKRNHLIMKEKDGIKRISSSILAGEKVTIAVEGEYEGEIPEELTYTEPDSAASILISPYRKQERNPILQLFPKAFVLGVGCRKGKNTAEIERFAEKQLAQIGIPFEAVAEIVSVDRKADEAGLCTFAERYGLHFRTFSPETLKAVPGNYASSAFVETQLGVDNVCERAAMAACKAGGRLILQKQAENGITLAVAERKWSVSFYEI